MNSFLHRHIFRAISLTVAPSLSLSPHLYLRRSPLGSRYLALILSKVVNYKHWCVSTDSGWLLSATPTSQLVQIKTMRVCVLEFRSSTHPVLLTLKSEKLFLLMELLSMLVLILTGFVFVTRLTEARCDLHVFTELFKCQRAVMSAGLDLLQSGLCIVCL